MVPLFDNDSSWRSQEQLEEGAMLLCGFAAVEAPVLVDEVTRISHAAAFRHMVTASGYTVSVAMTIREKATSAGQQRYGGPSKRQMDGTALQRERRATITDLLF
jgi:alkylated DNA repair dioxygenase AlkB